MGNHKRFLFYFHLDCSSCLFFFSFFCEHDYNMRWKWNRKKKIPTLKIANKGKQNKRICLLVFSFFELLTLSDLSWAKSPLSCYKVHRWFPASSMLNGPNILNGINDLLLWFIIWSLTCLTRVFFNFSPFVSPFPNRRADSQSNLLPFDIII